MPGEGWSAGAAPDLDFPGCAPPPSVPRAELSDFLPSSCVHIHVAVVCPGTAPLHPLPHQNLERAKRRGLWEKLSRGCLSAELDLRRWAEGRGWLWNVGSRNLLGWPREAGAESRSISGFSRPKVKVSGPSALLPGAEGPGKAGCCRWKDLGSTSGSASHSRKEIGNGGGERAGGHLLAPKADPQAHHEGF